jgi:hypothetical protein
VIIYFDRLRGWQNRENYPGPRNFGAHIHQKPDPEMIAEERAPEPERALDEAQALDGEQAQGRGAARVPGWPAEEQACGFACHD